MRSFRMAFIFGLTGVLTSSISAAGSHQKNYNIAVSDAIADTFPEISDFLSFLADQTGSPIIIHPQPVSLRKRIKNKFKEVQIVVAFASEAPTALLSFVKYEPARQLKATFLAISETSDALSKLKKRKIFYPDYGELREFTADVVDVCLFAQAVGKKTENEYLPMPAGELASEDIDEVIIKTFMDKKHVLYESKIADLITEEANKDMKFVPFFSEESVKKSFLSCLDTSSGDYDFEETSISSVVEYNDIFTLMYDLSGRKETKLHGVIKKDRINLYMNKSSYDEFRTKFFLDFLQSSYSNFKNRYSMDTPPDIVTARLVTFADAYELITDRNRGVIEAATMSYYLPARRNWHRLPRKNIQNGLGMGQGLDDSDRVVIVNSIDYLERYFGKIGRLPSVRIENERLIALRILAYFQYFLHQDALNKDNAERSRHWLRESRGTIEKHERLIEIVEKSPDTEYRELKGSEAYDGELNLWKPRLAVLRRKQE